MIRGSCLCGGVRFEADEIPLITHCHCSMCRKAHGAAFGTLASARMDQFRFTQGEDLIQTYESSPGNHRGFCRVCGSSVPVVRSGAETVSVPAGLLDDDPEVRPALHMFVASKAPWWEVTDKNPKFDEWVPGYGPEDES